MSQVQFDTAVGGDDSIVTDDDDASTGLANGGFWTRLVPMFTQIIAVSNYVKDLVTTLTSGVSAGMRYTFSSTTTDSDPTPGFMRLGSATQNAATTIRFDLVGADAQTWSTFIDLFDDSTSTVKGYLFLQKAGDASKWLRFSVSAVASPSGYKNVTVACVGYSAASPFTNGDDIIVKFDANGDKGDTGLTGPSSFPVPTAQGGTVDAITATYSPVTALTNNLFWSLTSAGPNTVVNPTFSPDSLAAKTIKARGGQPLRIGDTGAAGACLILQYHTSGTYFELLNPQSEQLAGYTTQGTGTVTLTSASTFQQRAVPTAFDCAFVLPDATTLLLGLKYILNNDSIYPMPIQANGGVLVGWVMPGQSTKCWLRVNGTAAGTWKMETGDIGADCGLNWWSSAAPLTTVGTTAVSCSVMLSSQYGILSYHDGTDYTAVGFDLLDFAIGSPTVIHAGITPAIGGVDGMMVTSTRAYFIYANSTTTVYCRCMDITTSSLALSAKAEITLDSATGSGTGIGCDFISATRVFVGYPKATSGVACRTVDIDGAGVCTANTPQTVTTSFNPYKLSVKVLSTTLAHMLYADNGSNMHVTRVVLTGATVAPGTPVSIANRQMLLTNNDLGKAPGQSTVTWSVVRGVSNQTTDVYGQTYTDTGSTITVVETTIMTQSATSTNTTRTPPNLFAANDANGSGLLYCVESGGKGLSFGTARVSGTAVSCKFGLQQSPNMAAIPPATTTAETNSNSTNRVHPAASGLGLFPVFKFNNTALALQPMALA